MPSSTEHALQLLRFALVAAGPVPLCLWLAHRDGERGASHTLLLFLGAWATLQVAIGLALGLTGSLSAAGVFAAEGALLVCGAALYWRAGAPKPWAGWRETWDHSRVDDRAATAILCALAVLSVVVLRQLALTVVWDWDTMWYHVPAMAQWHYRGAITVPGIDIITARYPYNWELLCTLFVYPFADDWLIFVPNALAWAMFGLSVYTTARLMGAARTASAAAAALVLTLPLVQSNLPTMHVDLAMAAWAMCGYYLALRFHTGRRGLHLGAMLVCLGMLVGIKTSGLVYGAALLALLAVLEGRRALRQGRFGTRRTWRSMALPLGAGALVALGLCGSWYLRNLVLMGNPIGEVELSLAGRVLFPGIHSSHDLRYTTLLAVFDASRADHWRLLRDALCAQGGWHALGLALPLAMWPLTAAIRRRSLGPWTGVVLVSVAVALLIYSTTPHSASDRPIYDGALTFWFAQSLRYGLTFAGLLGVAAAVGATRTGLHPAVPTGAALVAAAATPAPVGLRYLMVVALGLVPVFIVPAVAHTNRARIARGRTTPLRLAAVALGCALLVPLVRETHTLREEHASLRNRVFQGIPEYLQAHTVPGEAIGSVLNLFSYPLHGSGMDRRVAYWDNHFYQRITSMESLLAWMAEEGAVFVGVGPLNVHPSGPDLQAWLAAEDSPLIHVAGGDPWSWVALYRLRDG